MSTTLTIRNLAEPIKRKLRIQAASNGRSMEAEAREILAAGVSGKPTKPVSTNKKGRFDHLVGCWEGRMTTDQIMELTRGDDSDDVYSRR